jgi:hypothetical protein
MFILHLHPILLHSAAKSPPQFFIQMALVSTPTLTPRAVVMMMSMERPIQSGTLPRLSPS